MTKRSNSIVFFHGVLLAAGIALTAPAFAAQPWISGPSTANENQPLVVTGGNLSPNSTLSLQIIYPDGMVTSQIVAVDGEGQLKLDYPLGTPGGYTVKVYDTAGTLIGGGMLGFIR